MNFPSNCWVTISFCTFLPHIFLQIKCNWLIAFLICAIKRYKNNQNANILISYNFGRYKNSKTKTPFANHCHKACHKSPEVAAILYVWLNWQEKSDFRQQLKVLDNFDTATKQQSNFLAGAGALQRWLRVERRSYECADWKFSPYICVDIHSVII